MRQLAQATVLVEDSCSSQNNALPNIILSADEGLSAGSDRGFSGVMSDGAWSLVIMHQGIKIIVQVECFILLSSTDYDE